MPILSDVILELSIQRVLTALSSILELLIQASNNLTRVTLASLILSV